MNRLAPYRKAVVALAAAALLAAIRWLDLPAEDVLSYAALLGGPVGVWAAPNEG